MSAAAGRVPAPRTGTGGGAAVRAPPTAPLVGLRRALAGGGWRLVVDLARPHRCLSSAVLGGGLAWARTWLDLQVALPYTRTDPDAHLLEEAGDLVGPVVGMLTAARVAEFRRAESGGALAVATVGVGHPLAAAGNRPRAAPAAGTINMLVVVDQPLTDAGLVGALQTAVEAKAQALAAARVAATNAAGYATGTATDAVCIACPPGGQVPFAGPVTRVGADLARAVLEAIRSGAELAATSGRGRGNDPSARAEPDLRADLDPRAEPDLRADPGPRADLDPQAELEPRATRAPG